MIVVRASISRRGICIGRDIDRVREVGGEGLDVQCQSFFFMITGSMEESEIHTCKDWTFEQLDQLVNLNEHVHSHFQVGEDLQKIICLFVCLS